MSNNIYGIMAEFDTATELVDGARALRDAGYTLTAANAERTPLARYKDVPRLGRQLPHPHVIVGA